MPTPVANPQFQGGLIALDSCDGASGVCAIVDLGLAATPIDLPIVDSPPPPIDDLAPPIDDLAPPIDDLAVQSRHFLERADCESLRL
jgi:hypothetical protein